MIVRIIIILIASIVSVTAADDFPLCNGAVAPSELRQIKSVIREATREPIERYGRCRDGTVSIWAGHHGVGELFRLRKRAGKWKIIQELTYTA